MILKKLLIIFLAIFSYFTFAQRKKKTDTIYVYEKIIIYDTIYLEKSINTKSADLLIFTPQISHSQIKENKKINKDESEELIKNQQRNKTKFGIQAGVGFKDASWTHVTPKNKTQFGENIGIWISKNLFNSNFSFEISANIYFWNSTFNLDANVEETYLNGFYFSKNDDPLLFQRFNNKHHEYALQVKALYEWKKFRPFIGFLANKNIYKMQFLVPENMVLNKLDDFKSKNINLGYSLGLQYQISSRFILDFQYQYYTFKNISLKNKAFDFDIFKTGNTFAERKFNLGISYAISK